MKWTSNTHMSALLMVVAVLFTGCGIGGVSFPANSGTARPAATNGVVSPAIQRPSNIDFSEETPLTGYLVGAPVPGFNRVMTELNKKLKQDLNVTMNIHYIGWGEMQSKYPLILEAGEDVDWVFTGSWAFYAQLAGKGAFMEITPDMLQRYMPRHNVLIRDTTAMKEARINGKSYMIPTSTPDRKVSVFVYREDLRKKYGLPKITRMSDIEPYLAAVKANEPGMIPLNVGSYYDMQRPFGDLVTEQESTYQDILFSTGGGSGIIFKPLEQDGQLYYISQSPILPLFRQAALTMKSWYDKGYINKNAYANKTRSKESFIHGKSAVGFGNSIDIQGTIAQAISEGFEVGLVPVVSGNSGKAAADPYIGNGVAIAESSKNPEKTMMAMDLIMEDEAYDNLVYYGVEGVNYRVENNKIVLMNDNAASKDAYPPDQAGFWFTNKDLFKPLSSWSPSYLALQESLKTMLQPNVYASFAPDVDSIRIETENCNQIITQYFNPIQLGTFKDVTTAFTNLDDKLRSAGVERIMREMQKQTKAFLVEQRQ